MKRQGIYWLCLEQTPAHLERASWLEELDYQVSFFPSLLELEEALVTKRVSIIIVGDEFDYDHAHSAMSRLASKPDIQGARLIYSLSHIDDPLCLAAASNGFRDILPFHLEQNEWLHRFQFSTSGSVQDSPISSQKPIKLPRSITLGIPARISWLNRERLWLESKARPYLKDKLQLIGSFSKAIHQEPLELTVESQEDRNLIYRFSEAAVCNWSARELDDTGREELFTELKSINEGVKKRVFIAIQSPALRNAILKYLDPNLYDIHTALQKKSLVNEPKYFTPSLVFIEYRLCEGGSMSRFQEMVSQIPESSTVVLVGAKQENLHQFRNFASGRRLESLFQLPKNLPDLIQNSYLPPSKGIQEERYHIPRNHPYSAGEIIIEGDLLEIDGNCWRISLPMGLANFGLIRLQLGDENLFAKVVGSTGQAPREGKKPLGKEELDCLVSFLDEDHAKRALKQLKQAKLVKS